MELTGFEPGDPFAERCGQIAMNRGNEHDSRVLGGACGASEERRLTLDSVRGRHLST